jgi:hypothetical protein
MTVGNFIAISCILDAIHEFPSRVTWSVSIFVTRSPFGCFPLPVVVNDRKEGCR